MQGSSTSSPTSNPIGPESTASSPSSTSVTVASPSTTGSSATGQSQSSGGGGVVTSAASSSSSTASSSTSKGEGGRMINVAGDGSLLVRTHAEAPILVKLTQFSSSRFLVLYSLLSSYFENTNGGQEHSLPLQDRKSTNLKNTILALTL